MPICVCVRTAWSDEKPKDSRLWWVTLGWLKRFLCIGEVILLPKASQRSPTEVKHPPGIFPLAWGVGSPHALLPGEDA